MNVTFLNLIAKVKIIPLTSTKWLDYCNSGLWLCSYFWSVFFRILVVIVIYSEWCDYYWHDMSTMWYSYVSFLVTDIYWIPYICLNIRAYEGYIIEPPLTQSIRAVMYQTYKFTLPAVSCFCTMVIVMRRLFTWI